ncbi:hypothetical protein ABZ931_25480 [Streptomyces neyagawaensis]|uniref:Uncharacterized protein n=1 Tax=Streptomyces neyagawaensis TaxID=42238 RepID=A0ABV3B4I2_9ACTN
MSDLYAGQVYGVDMDPRWVKRLIRAGRLADATEYTTHLLEQGSGTRLSPDMYRDFMAAMDDGICGRSYGNTFGNAAGLPVEQNAELMPYVPNYPQVTMNVVHKEDWSTTVEYGTVGQVRLTVLHEDLFLPNILERDQALRYDTGSAWPSDGVANVTPLRTTSSALKGLY